jgi:ABC-type multidrug transport system fused ATPase/permease subunit
MITRVPLRHWVLRKHRGAQLFLFLLILAGIAFRVFPLEMQKRIVNEAIRRQREDLLFLYCGLYLAAVILSGLFKYAANVFQKKLGQKILVTIRQELYAHILLLPLGFFRRTQAGTIITAMTSELAAIGHFIGGAVAVPVTSVLTLLAFAVYMIWLDPILGLASIAIYPFELVLVPMLQNRYNRRNVERIDSVREMSNVVGEAVGGIHEIQGNAAFAMEREKLDRPIRDLFDVLVRMFRLKYGIKFVNNFFQNLGPFLLFLIGGWLAIQGKFTLGALVAFLSAYEKLYDPWKELIEYYQELQDARVRYRRVMEQFDIAPEYDEVPEGRAPLRLAGHLSAADLAYTVEGGIRLLGDIGLELAPGEHLALVGPSGSGKSTLAMLLGQLYRYRRGRIEIDGHELNDLTKADVGRTVGFVAQHPYIFTGTIRENLLYGCRCLQAAMGENACRLPDDLRLVEAARTVGLGDDLVRFGLDTVVDPDRNPAMTERIFRMRAAVHSRLAAAGKRDVEFFDVNRFLEHIDLYHNLLFGDVRNDRYRLENLHRNRRLPAFLAEEGLEAPLIVLGRDLARETVHLLQDLKDDEFFFEASPLRPDEIETYAAVVQRVETSGIEGLNRDDAMRLLRLGLSCIPARHKMVAVPDRLRGRILAARQRAIREIGGANLDRCRDATRRFLDGRPPGSPEPAGNPDFSLYCPTEYLAARSLLENILFGTPKSAADADAAALRELVVGHLEAEGLLDDVMAVGIDAPTGSKGDRLSGGQRQKIAIARALLKETPILILDEATASLDNVSRRRIQEYLENTLKGRTTVVAVIHRLDTAAAYDRILVLKAGRVAETGDWNELMERRGAFYELVHGKG